MPEKIISEMVIGQSEAIAQVRAMARYSVATQASVLITGGSGSGKEVVARAIHTASLRRHCPYVAVNSAAIPSELFESELFGHEAGSFTGARTRHIGLFEQAEGGTLFLDEIGEMPLQMQVKLLRVLEERVIRRVGGTCDIPIDVRIIAATNRNPREEIAEKRFREDLFYRLSVIPLHLPSLAQRPEDIRPLSEHFLEQLNCVKGTQISDGAITRLQKHDWPGNIRELRNLIERATIFFPAQMIEAEHIEILLNDGMFTSMSPTSQTEVQAPIANALREEDFSLQRYIGDVEREVLIDALTQCGGVIAQAARLVDVQRTTFVEKMRRHGINRDDCEAA